MLSSRRSDSTQLHIPSCITALEHQDNINARKYSLFSTFEEFCLESGILYESSVIQSFIDTNIHGLVRHVLVHTQADRPVAEIPVAFIDEDGDVAIEQVKVMIIMQSFANMRVHALLQLPTNK